MKADPLRKLVFIIALLYSFSTKAQPYLISFAATGSSTTVSTVKVENLTKGATLTVNGIDILRLTISTGVNSLEDTGSSELKIYPNPMTDNSNVEILPPVAGDALITIYEMSGNLVIQIQSHLEKFRQSFRVSGLKSGFYLINVRGNDYQFTGKLLSNGKSGRTIKFEKVSNLSQGDSKTEKAIGKGAQATVDMDYTTGDLLRFTGVSGNFICILKDIPASDKTIIFDFIACIDGSSYSYPMAGIGDQVWMSMNLKTKKYNDGTDIPLITDNATWSNLDTPGYCWYDNWESMYRDIYGALYNWYTVNTGKLCPAGWHVPGKIEWAALVTCLGGESVAGGKMKETTNVRWISPNTGATNESGFTARPGGLRVWTGPFDGLKYCAYFWSSTGDELTMADFLCLIYNNGSASVSGLSKPYGFSIRCLRN